jgi:hypothetical protein
MEGVETMVRPKAHATILYPADLRGSRFRARALRLGRPALWLLYCELLWALYDAGGYLPADPETLADHVAFVSPDEIAELLPLLAPAGDDVRGGIVVEDGRIYCRRVLESLEAERAYRAGQAERGASGGRATAKQSLSDGLATAKRTASKSQPIPSPSPSPSPQQLCGIEITETIERGSGAERPARDRATSAAENSLSDARGFVARSRGTLDSPGILDHDPDRPAERDLAERIEGLAKRLVDADPSDREALVDETARVLEAVTATPDGRGMDAIRGAPEPWLRASLRVADRFEAEMLDLDATVVREQTAPGKRRLGRGLDALLEPPQDHAAAMLWAGHLATLRTQALSPQHLSLLLPTVGHHVYRDGTLVVRGPDMGPDRAHLEGIASAVTQCPVRFEAIPNP